jgi:hypothetical protein
LMISLSLSVIQREPRWSILPISPIIPVRQQNSFETELPIGSQSRVPTSSKPAIAIERLIGSSFVLEVFGHQTRCPIIAARRETRIWFQLGGLVWHVDEDNTHLNRISPVSPIPSAAVFWMSVCIYPQMLDHKKGELSGEERNKQTRRRDECRVPFSWPSVEMIFICTPGIGSPALPRVGTASCQLSRC